MQLLLLIGFVDMNADLCNLHNLPINQICGTDKCSAIMCEVCFSSHQKQTNHSMAIILNPSTISFFINFNDFILKQIDGFLALINNGGINSVIKINGGIPNYWDAKTILTEITKLAIEIIINFRTLIQNNRNYVADNRSNYRCLLHPQFLKDIYSLITQKWSKSAQKLAQDLRLALTTTYPTRYIYKRIKFQFNSSVLTEIQQKKKQILSQLTENIFKQYKQPSRLSDLQISKVQSIIEKNLGSFSEEKKQPRFSANIDSFYEILENSQANLKQDSFQMAPILRQNAPEVISPNFLSYEALEKQIEELLIENQRLKQANFELLKQNSMLKDENAQLKTKRN